MVKQGAKNCPNCGGVLVRYDKVKRIVRTVYGKKNIQIIRRKVCKSCKSVHRELKSNILPYKHYDKDIWIGVIKGYITFETLGYEDFPSEQTMRRWISEYNTENFH